jgi:hypothetical protein
MLPQPIGTAKYSSVKVDETAQVEPLWQAPREEMSQSWSFRYALP